MTFYENFELALEKTGMSTADVCAKTGIYQSYFSKLKKGTTNRTLETFASIRLNA